MLSVSALASQPRITMSTAARTVSTSLTHTETTSEAGETFSVRPLPKVIPHDRPRHAGPADRPALAALNHGNAGVRRSRSLRRGLLRRRHGPSSLERRKLGRAWSSLGLSTLHAPPRRRAAVTPVRPDLPRLRAYARL